MIAAVRGEVLVRRSDHVVVEAAGVGYRLNVSTETLRSVPAAGQEVFLHTETISRDDSLVLYGFSAEEERDLFQQLIGVSGIGPKVAIAALSGGPYRELTAAIVGGDAKRFQAVPGIGKRTAERIILELRDRVTTTVQESGGEIATPAESSARSLARDGLINLGYTPLEAEQMLDGLDPGDDAQALVAEALRRAGSPNPTVSPGDG
ncbi:MAG: Holliday junction branch migration protein RuvA [Solirubrobacterales bacterium]|nr:Holliday junction branch migration protein RuvA [Solirubrobacterales bacterium]